ncbi:MAG: tRNA (adenosine(37)-N6)-threonylcarbamoyltransferase complex transferase subunit TsaD [Bacilli bacterium]|nr:tRNA (adenosine(37)-N6)-threonylcarbamoyltransferase complex transferase subunit TsaD [Bacilli bacterium]
MKRYILGIESSCDETSCAVIDENGKLLSNVVSSQIDVHTKFGGVMPEIASRMHVEQISIVIKKAIDDANITFKDLKAIAVTRGPGLIGALHVGLQAAKTLALALEIPLIPVHHLAGHIYANTFIKELEYPCMALVVSGGHTQLVYMEKEFSFNIIGGTKDDAIGEAYDKVARVIGLGYPGGPKIDKKAKEGKPSYKLPTPHVDSPFDVSYSGLKTAVINLAHNTKARNETLNDADLCASFQQTAVHMVVKALTNALEVYPCKMVVVAGGVAANSYLRSYIKEQVKCEVLLPELWCCSDNAAMIAKVAKRMDELKMYAPLDIGVNPNWSLSDFIGDVKNG